MALLILTVTMNPSVDISYPLESLKIDQVNRCNSVTKTAGGKGLNVTRVIHQMNQEVLATGLLGGSLGVFIEEQLDSQNIAHHFSYINDQTRNCIAILHDEEKQTEILESGPTVSNRELQQFKEQLKKLMVDVNVVTISGSLPKGAPRDFYADLLKELETTQVKVILDTSGDSLKHCLLGTTKPYGIKPNIAELEALTGDTIPLDEEVLMNVLQQKIFTGVSLIVVSLGKDGAFVKFQGEFYRVTVPNIQAVNPVGSGDATVAGLAIAINNDAAIKDLLKTAMTLGVLNTMEEKTGFVNKQHFETYFSQVIVRKI